MEIFSRRIRCFNLLALTACLFAASAVASAQSLSSAGVQRLDSYLQQAVETTHIPGMVALVVSKDGILYEKSFGLMNSANERAMTNDAIFRIASMTKPVTSVAVMMLVEEGKVSLDAPIANYLPELANREVFTDFNLVDGTYTAQPAERQMTVRHLLTHTSGLGYTFDSPVLAKAMGDTFTASATSLPLLHEPGTQWTYGESTRVLGHLVERVTGQNLFDFMAERILEPLEMTDTFYDIPAGKNHRTVTVHRTTDEGLVEGQNPEGVLTSPANGDGGLASTARDYSRFIRMFLNDGALEESGQLLSPETIANMGRNHIGDVRVALMPTTNPQTSLPFPLGAGVDTFGLGFQVTESRQANMRSPGSMAWAGIFNTEFWIDPEQGVGAVLMMQLLPFYDEAAIEVLQGFEQRVYAGLAGE